MIERQAMLMRRELWEHRSILVTPAVMAILIALTAITGHVAVSAFGQQIDIALLAASNLGARERAATIGVMMTGVSSVFVIAMWILTVFYCLDALYAERKDRSILFWRSLPCTDTETVLSKLAVALLVIPLLTLAAVIVTHLAVLIVTTVWVDVRGADAWRLLWSAAPFVDNWVATLVVLLAVTLWLSPFVGWFLFVSGFVKRAPFLVAFLPILVLPMLERTLLGTSLLAQAFFVRSARLPLFHGLDTGELFFREGSGAAVADGPGIGLLALLDPGRFLSSPGLWLGLVVCGLFTAAAIYVRRYRDDA